MQQISLSDNQHFPVYKFVDRHNKYHIPLNSITITQHNEKKLLPPMSSLGHPEHTA